VVGLSVVEELISLVERTGCVNVVRWSREHNVEWVSIRDDVIRGLERRGYDVRFKGVWMCLEGVKDLDSKIAELLLQEGCVNRRKIMSMYNLTLEEWKRLKRRVVKRLAAKGYKLYKHGYWTYCVEGAKPKMAKEMTTPLTVKLDPETHARLEELAKKKGVSKAEIVREIIEEYLG
jgi:predicted HicB family RNase H-like nuclease